MCPAVGWPWAAATATVTDAFGRTETVPADDGALRLPVSVTVTPLFVEE